VRRVGRMQAGWVRSGSATVLTISVVAVSLLVAPALAQAGPAWRITGEAVPSNVPPGGKGLLVLGLANVGDAPSAAGSPVTVVDRLPQGIVATKANALESQASTLDPSGLWGECAITEAGQAVIAGRTVTCTYQAGATIAPASVAPVIAPFLGVGAGALAPAIGIEVSVEPSAAGTLIGTATVSGGRAPGEASDTASFNVSSSPAPFGVASFHQWSTNVDGTPATQAGSHPYETTTSFMLNNQPEDIQSPFGGRTTGGILRDLHVELPPGFVGNPIAIPKCSRQDFDVRLDGSLNPSCPSDTQIGVAQVYLEPNYFAQVPLYNLVPPGGVPAQFGVAFAKLVAFIDADVRPGPGGVYNVVVDTRDINTKGVLGASVVLWGDPAESSHNKLRLPRSQSESHNGNDVPSDVAPRPFLSLPSSCGVPQSLVVSAVSWRDPLTVPFLGAASTDEQGAPVMMAGCSKLDFSPSVGVQPGTTVAESPAGLSVKLKVSQNEAQDGLTEADLRNVNVTFPAGMTVSPSAANGLQACSEEQIGVSGSGPTLLFNESPAVCPAASKIGSVEVTTPLLEHPLTGAMYLAQQNNNPFGSLVALYLVAEGSGVLVKRAGEVHLDQQTGQITVTFLDNPQVPLSEIKVKTFQNARSSVMTPSGCGTYTTTTILTAWNGSVATPSPLEPFSINGNCAQGFKPAFTAETTNNQAGSLSPFTVTFSRQDGEQRIADASVQTPPGLLGSLRGVQQCPEPQASNATCGAESQIGHATVAVGPGPEPFYAPANVFLTGPYGGAPFGLSIVARAVAGPFDLGTVVVRARVSIDPVTAQITVTPDSGGLFAIPTILKGIPLDLRLTNITIERPGGTPFLFNPTSCSPLNVNGTMISTSGTIVGVSSPFQATGCAKLPFKPVFSASTQGKTSKANGASLTVKITKKSGEANLHKADVQLPIALPARLTTLQKACTEKQFNVNPAGCPAASVIGVAKLNTPVLNVQAMGPAFLVSHGGAAFPDVEFVLQGEGVTVVVDGATNIKKGITYSRFETAPDAPFSSFETRFPEGPYSVLATNIPANAKGSLCGQALTMPTALTGHNGAQLTQTTRIGVSGCPKTKRAKKASVRRKHVKPTGRTR
jgi:hypothetical protein